MVTCIMYAYSSSVSVFLSQLKNPTVSASSSLSLSDIGKKYLVCESLSQQWQRISNEVKLIWRYALAAVSSNGQGIPLRIDAKEL